MLKKSLQLLPSRPEMYQAKLAFYLFLASLGMFFAVSLISYCVIRADALRDLERNYLQLELPAIFWISTALLVGVSFYLQLGCYAVHRERPERFVSSLRIALIFSVAFVLLQMMGMTQLVQIHLQGIEGSNKAYGICFILAFLHALHVIGGIVFLGFVIFQARRGRYDHERHWAVDNCASYWHFLDVVWVLMLVTFVVNR